MEIYLHLEKQCWPLMRMKVREKGVMRPIGPVVEVASPIGTEG